MHANAARAAPRQNWKPHAGRMHANAARAAPRQTGSRRRRKKVAKTSGTNTYITSTTYIAAVFPTRMFALACLFGVAAAAAAPTRMFALACLFGVAAAAAAPPHIVYLVIDDWRVAAAPLAPPSFHTARYHLPLRFFLCFPPLSFSPQGLGQFCAAPARRRARRR